MTDRFKQMARSANTPSEHAFTVSPSDTVPLEAVPKYIYVGGGGSVTLRATDSRDDVVFENVPSGSYLYVRASHIRATGTTATAIVACA